VSVHVPDSRPNAAQPTLTILTLKRAAVCRCGTALAAGQRAAWDRANRMAHCLPCAQEAGAESAIAASNAHDEPRRARFGRWHGRQA
jgi:hypothetical protein